MLQDTSGSVDAKEKSVIERPLLYNNEILNRNSIWEEHRTEVELPILVAVR